MRLYYGSKTNFQKPIYGVGSLNNDYGLGFYLTPSYEMARLWASKFDEGGYVLTFDIDFSDLQICDLNKDDEETVLKWITILVSHRFDLEKQEKYKDRINWLKQNFSVNLDGYDMVVGYRADDSYFNYSEKFVSDDLSFEILTRAMKLGKLGLQYVLISRKAFSKPVFIKSEKIAHSNEYDEFRKQVNEEYHQLKITDLDTNTFIRDIRRKYEKQ